MVLKSRLKTDKQPPPIVRKMWLRAPKATEVVGPRPFKRTLLRGPLVHFGFDLNSISCIIVGIKT